MRDAGLRGRAGSGTGDGLGMRQCLASVGQHLRGPGGGGSQGRTQSHSNWVRSPSAWAPPFPSAHPSAPPRPASPRPLALPAPPLAVLSQSASAR